MFTDKTINADDVIAHFIEICEQFKRDLSETIIPLSVKPYLGTMLKLDILSKLIKSDDLSDFLIGIDPMNFHMVLMNWIGNIENDIKDISCYYMEENLVEFGSYISEMANCSKYLLSLTEKA